MKKTKVSENKMRTSSSYREIIILTQEEKIALNNLLPEEMIDGFYDEFLGQVLDRIPKSVNAKCRYKSPYELVLHYCLKENSTPEKRIDIHKIFHRVLSKVLRECREPITY